jgi:hypothetical protein
MNRADAIARAAAYFDNGQFFEDLARRVAFRTEWQSPDAGRLTRIKGYLAEGTGASVERLGFTPELRLPLGLRDLSI